MKNIKPIINYNLQPKTTVLPITFPSADPSYNNTIIIANNTSGSTTDKFEHHENYMIKC